MASWIKSISKHKSIEIEARKSRFVPQINTYSLIGLYEGVRIGVDLCNLFGFCSLLTWHCDHAGARFELTLFGVCLSIELYDTRHWDYDHNCWENDSI
jgi:hypothetical protein